MKNVYFLLLNILQFPLNKYKRNIIHLSVRKSKNTLISKTTIGRGSYIACNVVLNSAIIGNYCSIAPGVQIGGMEHSHWWLSTSTRLSDHCIHGRKTKIGNDVWIGAGSIIKQGINIGDGAVIGAMSFVNSDVPDNSIYFGSPAKFYKKRFKKEIFETLKESNYWNLNQKNAKIKLLELERQGILT